MTLRVFAMAFKIAAVKQAAMHRRMQRLDPAIHHFWKTRQISNIDHVEACLFQCAGRATGRDQLYAMRGEPLAMFDKPGLV